MKLDLFIEAEEVAGRSVKHCCDMFQVSRAAYYERRRDIPSAREVTDAELAERIKEVWTGSDGTYGSPRLRHELLARALVCGRRRVRRLMRIHGLAGPDTEDRARHGRVPRLVRADAVALRQSEQLGDSLGIDEVVEIDGRRHADEAYDC